MNQVDVVQGFSPTQPTFVPTVPVNNNQQPRAFQGPLLGLLVAASLLAKTSQLKPTPPYLPDLGQNPVWNPFKPLLPVWYPLPDDYRPYAQKLRTTASPQIQSPPLYQQQIIHIHDSTSTNDEQESEVYQDVSSRNHQQIINGNTGEHDVDIPKTVDVKTSSQEDVYNFNDFEISPEASNDHVVDVVFSNSNSSQAREEIGEDALATNMFYERQRFDGNKRRRYTKSPTTSRRETKRPNHQNYDEEYQETRNRNRKRPTRRRTTTPSYEDYDRPNRRKRRPPMKNKYSGSRRPINSSPNYYDSSEYGDDYYDDYNYSNEFNIFARQGTTTTTESDTDTTTTTETTTGSTETTATTATTSPGNTTAGYTYGPPHTGYGPSNGNENISITYGPPTGPKQEMGPSFDAWYNHYTKNSVFRRLQELLTPNNFYNHHYDVNYHDNF